MYWFRIYIQTKQTKKKKKTRKHRYFITTPERKKKKKKYLEVLLICKRDRKREERLLNYTLYRFTETNSFLFKFVIFLMNYCFYMAYKTVTNAARR